MTGGMKEKIYSYLRERVDFKKEVTNDPRDLPDGKKRLLLACLGLGCMLKEEEKETNTYSFIKLTFNKHHTCTCKTKRNDNKNSKKEKKT